MQAKSSPQALPFALHCKVKAFARACQESFIGGDQVMHRFAYYYNGLSQVKNNKIKLLQYQSALIMTIAERTHLVRT